MRFIPGAYPAKEGGSQAFTNLAEARRFLMNAKSKRGSRFSKNSGSLAILAMLVCLVFALTTPAWSQGYMASITGVVQDPSGAVIPGAKVTATNLDNGFTYPTTTNAEGRYTITSLPPGNYKIGVAAKGFQSFSQSGLSLSVSQHATINAQLKVGATTQTVTVSGAAPLLQAQSSTTGQNVSRSLVSNLPLVGRSVFDLAFLAPGVSPAPRSAFGPNTMANNWVSNGGRNATADILIDGITTTAPEQNTQFLDPLYTPSVNAVQEYKVEQNNFSADKGFSGNTVVNVILRSGTNHFHGSVYEYNRYSGFNANNWFNNRAGLANPMGRNNDFGFTIGGPIQKDKTFFFFDYEGRRGSSGGSFSAGVPSAQERQGNFGELCADNGGSFNSQGICSVAAGQLYDPYSGYYNNAIGQRELTTPIPYNNMATFQSAGSPLLVGTPFQLPATPGNLINPVAYNMMQYYPLPNLNVGTSSYNRFDNWAGTASDSSKSNQFDIKGDRQISDMTHLMLRFSRSSNTYNGFNPWNNPLNTNTQGPNMGTVDSAVLQLTHSFSPTLVMNASYGYTRMQTNTEGVDKNFPNFNPIQDLGLPSYMGTSNISASPTIYIDGGYSYVGPESLGAQAWSVLHYTLETHDLLVSLDKMSGHHEFKFGGEMRLYRDYFQQPGAPAGVFEFNGNAVAQVPYSGQGDALAAFLTGVGGPGTWGEYEIPLTVATQNFEYAGYLQDNWHFTKNLTLNLGMRYDLYMPATERHNKQTFLSLTASNPIANQVPALSQQAIDVYQNAGLPVPNLSTLYGGTEFAGPGNRYAVNPSYNDFSPRFGFAYSFWHNTVVRGGYGIFYGTPDYTAHGTGLGADTGWLQTTNWNTTYNNNGYTPYATLSDPFPGSGPTGGLILPPGSSQGLLTDLGTGISGYVKSWNQVPYEQTWSLGVQHQFGSVLLDTEYVGTKGTHLYFGSAGGMNYFGPWIQSVSSAQLQALQTYVPNPFYGVITTPGCGNCGSYIQASGLLTPYAAFTGMGAPNPPWANSNYNALQIRVEKKFSHNLEFLANYTWEKTMDDASSSGSNTTWLGGTAPTPQDPNDLAAEYSISQYNVPQVLTFSYVYQLPFGKGQQFGGNWNWLENTLLGGWQTQGLWRFDTGQPLAITLSASAPLPTYGGQRPNLVGPLGVNNCNETCKLNMYFANPQNAQVPANYTLGTAPRNLNIYGPGTKDADLSIFKNIAIPQLGENGRLQIRLAAFNSFNHVQFGFPNGNVDQGSFGQTTYQANSPRQLQLGMELEF